MQVAVKGPGPLGVRRVPVGLSLWTGRRPVLEPRVVFYGRAKLRRGQVWTDGEATMNGERWWLIGHGIEEEFGWAGEHWVRHLAELWDERRDRVVGAFYWCENIGPWTEPDKSG